MGLYVNLPVNRFLDNPTPDIADFTVPGTAYPVMQHYMPENCSHENAF
jgi:hypothetical protein